MKTRLILILFTICALSACKPKEVTPEPETDKGVAVTIKFSPTFNGNKLGWLAQYVTGAGDSVSFDKIKFLISDFVLEKQGGELLQLKDQYAYISLKDGRDSVILTGVPKGDYKSIRFQVGLDSAVNHGDPAQWPSGHALNPALNEMHWGWAGGYIFNIIEGYFSKNGANAGFSFHIATLQNARTYSFVEDYKLEKNSMFTFEVKMDKYFSNMVNFSLKNDGAFSHSGDNDQVMAKFIQNVNGVIELKSFQ